MTAGERLIALSGLSGVSAAVMLQAIGSGATTGAALVNYSGLSSGTAAQHLLTDVSRETVTPSAGVRRQFVQIGKKLREVSSIDEAEKLLALYKAEEKQARKETKRLEVLRKKIVIDLRNRPALEVKAEKLEQKIDDRYEFMAMLQEKINQLMDDEEALFLLL